MTTTFLRPLLIGLVALALLAMLMVASGALGLGRTAPFGGASGTGSQGAPAQANPVLPANNDAAPAVAPAAQPAGANTVPTTHTSHVIIVPAGGRSLTAGNHDSACPNNQPCDNNNH